MAMLIPAYDWNGVEASAEAVDIDSLLDVMIVISSRLRRRDGRHGLRDLEVPGQAGRRVRRRADPRQHPPRDHLDRDPDRDRPLRRRLLVDRPRRHRGQGRRPDAGRRHRPAVRLALRLPRAGHDFDRAARARSVASSSSSCTRSTSCIPSGSPSGGSSATSCPGRPRRRRDRPTTSSSRPIARAPTRWSAPSLRHRPFDDAGGGGRRDPGGVRRLGSRARTSFPRRASLRPARPAAAAPGVRDKVEAEARTCRAPLDNQACTAPCSGP